MVKPSPMAMAGLAAPGEIAPGRVMRVEEAQALINQTVDSVCDIEEVSLDQAFGRILGSDVSSPIPVPGFANAAVDGYALRHQDLTPGAETTLPLVGRSAAGHPAGVRLAPGTAMRILTGAMLPEGADTVVMQEQAHLIEGTVVLPAAVTAGSHCRRAGEDIATGTRILAAGQRLRPQDVAILAAAGQARISVRRRLKAAVLSIGDELADVTDGAPGPGRIFDSNRPMLRALLAAAGAEVSDLGIVDDDRDVIAAILAEAAGRHDLILTSGSASVGDEDHVRHAMAQVGRIGFWRLAIKPGKPVALGEIAGVPVVCLPGNPVAAMVAYTVLVQPLASRLAGALPTSPPHFAVTAGFSRGKRPGRREYVRVHLDHNHGLLPRAVPFARDGAGNLSSLVFADGFAVLPEELEQVSVGDTLAYLPFSALFA